MIGRLARLTQRVWALVSVAAALALVSVIAAVFEWWWLCVAGLAALQLGVAMGLLLGVRWDSARRMDALSARVMAAIETERLTASDRHREIVDLLQRKIEVAPRAPGEADGGISQPSHQVSSRGAGEA